MSIKRRVAGERVYHVWYILHEFRGHNFLSGLHTLKPKNLKNRSTGRIPRRSCLVSFHHIIVTLQESLHATVTFPVYSDNANKPGKPIRIMLVLTHGRPYARGQQTRYRDRGSAIHAVIRYCQNSQYILLLFGRLVFSWMISNHTWFWVSFTKVLSGCDLSTRSNYHLCK